MNPIIFLYLLAFVWMAFAVVQDLRKREIANWLNFSLIVFALGFRLFYSVFSNTGFNFFYQGLFGLAVFFVFGNLLYHIKLFAGGDAKLMIALGAVIPFDFTFIDNTRLFLSFILIFLVVGAVYGIIGSLYLCFRNWKPFTKEFSQQFRKNKKGVYALLIVAIVFLLLSFFNTVLLALAILAFLAPYIFIYSKAVDESCMIKLMKVSELTEGDWLYKDVRITKNKVIKSNWDGLTKQEIKEISKKHKKVLVRYGIPFSPAFIITFVIFFFYNVEFMSLLFRILGFN